MDERIREEGRAGKARVLNVGKGDRSAETHDNVSRQSILRSRLRSGLEKKWMKISLSYVQQLLQQSGLKAAVVTISEESGRTA